MDVFWVQADVIVDVEFSRPSGTGKAILSLWFFRSVIIDPISPPCHDSRYLCM